MPEPATNDRLARYLALGRLTDAEFVQHAFRFILRRDADAKALGHLVEGLGTAALSRARVIAGLLESDEFARVRRYDDALALARNACRQRKTLRELPRPPEGETARLVEFPWVLSRYRGERRVLDVGYAFADPPYLAELVALGAEQLVGVDLNEADVPGLTPVVADVRRLPFEDRSFDLAFCVSVIEHVGYDNEVYGLESEHDEEAIPAALAELRRVLARDGRMLVTVPSGRRSDEGWYVRLPLEEWRGLFARAGLVVAEDEDYGGFYCADLRPAPQHRRRFLGALARPSALVRSKSRG